MIKVLRKIYRYTYKAIFSKYDLLIEKEVRGYKTLLDVGCGTNSPVQSFNNKLECTGVDAFLPSIELSKAKGIHKEYHHLNVLEIDNKFNAASFDVVAALDLIEHLKKEDGILLMDKMEAIAKHKIIIYTPNGFVPQGDREKNPWQIHLSGWSADEFTARGYKVYGINGIQSLRGEYAKVKYKPAFLWNFISDLTEPFVKNKPENAFQLLAIKTKS